jgi:hypothetical protein
MHYMKILFIVMVSMALVAFSGVTFKGDAHVQTVAIILSGLFITWYGMKFICFACKNSDKAAPK